MTTSPDPKAVELRLAGLGFAQIAAQLGYTDAEAAASAVSGSLGHIVETPEDARRTEVARLDAILSGLWVKARRGDVAAVDRAMRLTARRARLLGVSLDGHGDLRIAFDASVEANAEMHVRVDGALVEAGRHIADRVDDAIATCEGQELTKALYLMPHLVNILREMLATPASRRNAGLIAREGAGGKLAHLRSANGPKKRTA